MLKKNGDTMKKQKLPIGQKLIKEIGDFLFIQQNHFYEYSGVVTDKVWFKYYIHKNALGMKGNYGVINVRDDNTYSVITKGLNLQIYKNLEDAFKYVEKEWA